MWRIYLYYELIDVLQIQIHLHPPKSQFFTFRGMLSTFYILTNILLLRYVGDIWYMKNPTIFFLLSLQSSWSLKVPELVTDFLDFAELFNQNTASSYLPFKRFVLYCIPVAHQIPFPVFDGMTRSDPWHPTNPYYVSSFPVMGWNVEH